MNNQNTTDIYEKVYSEIHPQVSSIRRGLLYKIIQIILDEEQSQSQEKTVEICDTLGIKSNASREDDNKVIDNLVDAVFVDRQTVTRSIPGRETLRSMLKAFNQKLFDNDKMEEIKWIIIGACTLTGLYFCIQYLKKVQNRRGESEQGVSQTPRQSIPRHPIPAELCLIIPARIASSLTLNSSLSLDSLIHLIDSASYFLCITSREAKSKEEQLLELTDEYIPSDSERGFYVRVTSSDGGRDLLNQEIPYILKRNLPQTAQFTVKKLAYLRSFKGLEEFNRV